MVHYVCVLEGRRWVERVYVCVCATECMSACMSACATSYMDEGPVYVCVRTSVCVCLLLTEWMMTRLVCVSVHVCVFY